MHGELTKKTQLEFQRISNDKKIIPLHILLLIFLGIITYCNTLRGDFIWDDNFLVKNNVYIKSWANIPKVFTKDIGAGAFAKYNFYRPMQMLTYMMDYSLWKLNPLGYHITNVLAHTLVTLGIYWLVSILFFDSLLSLFAGILFVIHPIHTETVAYISSRADSLAAVLVIMSLICYLYYLSSKRNLVLYAIVLFFYSLALLSKELSLVFPFLLILYHYVFKTKIRFKSFLPILAVTFSYVILRLICFRFSISSQMSYPSFSERLPGFFLAFTEYIRLLFLPFNLHMEYGQKLFKFNDPKVLLGIGLMAILFVWAYRVRNRSKIFFLSIIWFFITLLPQSNLYPINAYMAEHWLYLPSIGFCLLLGNGLSYFCRNKYLRVWGIIFSCVLLSFYAFLTIKQNSYWNNPLIFYQRTLKYAPDSRVTYINLGNVYKEMGRTEEAIMLYKQAIEIEPDAEAYYNLGNIFKEMHNTEEAISLYKKAIENNPRLVYAYNNLAVLYNTIGRYEEAISLFNQAIKINPDYIESYFNLGIAYMAIKKNEEAVNTFKKIIEINPNSQKVYDKLELIYYESGNYMELIKMYRDIIQNNPKHAQAYNNLGNIYKEMNKLDESILFYKTAIEINPQYAHAYNNLGIVYTLIGNDREALVAFNKAIEIEPAFADAHNNLAVIYYYQKQYDLAIKHCDRAIELRYSVNPEFLKLIEPFRK